MGVQQQDGTDRKRMQTFHADEVIVREGEV